jgi:hypothetical protein
MPSQPGGSTAAGLLNATMQYQTRHLVARVPMRYAGADLQPGDEFAASLADARYLTRNGRAQELAASAAQTALNLPPPAALEPAPDAPAAPAPAPAPRRTRRKPAAEPLPAAPADAAPAHDMRFDTPPPEQTGNSLQAELQDHDDGNYSSDLLTSTRGVI